MKKQRIYVLLAGMMVSAVTCAQQNSDIVTDNVTVTATRFKDSYSDKPVSVTVISAEEIRRSPARTVPELLSYQAGVGGRDLFGNNSAQASVDIRGFGAAGAQNSLILVDGRRQNDIDISGVQWSALPLDFIERIEIVRGSGAVLYGDGAVSGVINIITRKPGDAGKQSSITLGAGSFETYTARADGEVAGETAGLRLGGSYFDSQGYRDNNRNIQSAAYADARWHQGRDQLSLRYSGASQNLRLPGGRAVQPGIGVNLLETDRRGATTPKDYAKRDDGSLQFDWQSDGDRLSGILGLSYRRKEQVSYFDFGGFPDYREVELDVLAITPRLRLDHTELGIPGSLVAGFDWYAWDYRLAQASSAATIGQPIHRVKANQENRALYVQETLAFASGTTITGGARQEWFSIDATDAFDPTAPNPAFTNGGSPQGEQKERQHALELGLRQDFSAQWSAYARASRAFRFATVDELYEGSSSFEQEFQFLRPQTSETREVGLNWHLTTTTARLGVFRTDITDEIHLDPFSFGTGNTNLAPSRRSGLELELGTRPAQNVDLRFTYTYTEAKFLEGTIAGGLTSIAGKTVPLVARHRASLAAGLRLSNQLRLDAVSSYVSNQYMENDEENDFGTRIPGYTVTDLRAAYDSRRMSLDLTLSNLFDEEYYNYAVTSIFTPGRYSAYPLPGRGAMLQLKLRLP